MRVEDQREGRHAAVDVEGWLLSIVVTGAQVSDRAGAKLLAVRLLEVFTTLQIIQRSDPPGFQVVSRRSSSGPSAG